MHWLTASLPLLRSNNVLIIRCVFFSSCLHTSWKQQIQILTGGSQKIEKWHFVIVIHNFLISIYTVVILVLHEKVEFCVLVVNGDYDSSWSSLCLFVCMRVCVWACVSKPCEISSCRLCYIIGPSIYIYIHAFVHHSPGSSVSPSLVLAHARPLPPSFLSHLVRLRQIAELGGGGVEGGRGLGQGKSWLILILQSRTCAAAGWHTRYSLRKK